MSSVSTARYSETAPTPAQLADLFDGELGAASYSGDERGGVVADSKRPVHRLAFALEADDGLPAWIEMKRIDALFLHRHWKLDAAALPASVGVLAYHRPYDAHLTTGPNVPLARELGLRQVGDYGKKEDGEPVGMVGHIAPTAFEMAAIRVHHVFGDLDGVHAPRGGDRLVSRIAVMSAMSDELVRQAASDGIDIYVTGQYRPSAGKAVQETGIGVIAIGHARSERWGLHVLARTAELAFPGLETLIYRTDTSQGQRLTGRGQSPDR